MWSTFPYLPKIVITLRQLYEMSDEVHVDRMTDRQCAILCSASQNLWRTMTSIRSTTITFFFLCISCCRCTILQSPVDRVKRDSVTIPSQYEKLLAGYQERLGLETRECLIEIMLAFNAFHGTVFLWVYFHLWEIEYEGESMWKWRYHFAIC